MEGPSIVPMIAFFAVALSVCLIWFCLVKRFLRHAQQDVQSRTTVTSTHHPQYSHNQPVANNLQPAYGGHPILTGPCQQTYVPGPPPTYQEAAGLFPARFSQAAYDGGQIMYPLQPPVQPVLPTDYTSPQAPYNPAYVESAKTS
ncbi:protein shisa-5-like [Sinocyclocheilus rhinocerous]|uniref:protein shisa-5-like n=1 Tax=Sinocyclocheilus rhinocerous TaxID=307959 RepID=UPI0007B81E68|nr:PREDICTED: protein shisa-5-like [Sinocyclocheilus rhinocerous]